MRRRGMSAADIEAALQEVNARRCEPPLPEAEVSKIATSVSRYLPAASPVAAAAPLGGESVETPAPRRPGRTGQNGHKEEVAPPRALVLRPVRAIAAERIRWLWDGYIALGEVNVLAGSGGAGKTMVALDIAARVAGGLPIPGAHAASTALPGRVPVLYLTTENDPAKVLRPRIEAAALRLTDGDRDRTDAILDRVFVLRGVATLPDGEPPTDDPDAAVLLADVAADPSALVLPRDIGLLQDAVHTQGIRFLVIDPVISYADITLDVFNPSHMRHLLDPLAAFTHAEDCAVWAVVHFSKTVNTSIVLRISMSRQVTDTSRAVSVVLEDPRPEREDLRWLAMAKNNLGSRPPAYSYRVVGTTHPTFDDDTVAVAQWTGETRTGTADTIEAALEAEAKVLRAQASDPYSTGSVRGPRTKDAVQYLGEKLHEIRDAGDVVVTSQELEEWRTAGGYSPETWTKAREHLGVKTAPAGAGSLWTQDLADLDWLQKLPAQEDMHKLGVGYHDPTAFGPPTPHKPGTPGGTKTP
jgi:hypothetical protein